MGFTKLSNPKPTATLIPPDGVSVKCRELTRTKASKLGKPPGSVRFAVVTIGAGIARRAGLVAGKADVVIGDGLERLRCGISANPNGAFAVRKLASGNYQISLSERAGAGLLNLTAPPFVATAELVPMAANAPPCVMFDLSKEIRA